MASTLQVAMKTSFLVTSHHYSSRTPRRTCFSPLCSASAANKAKISSPPPYTKDSLLYRMASQAARSRKRLPNRTIDADVSDSYESPKSMAAPAQLERYDSYREDEEKDPPPDVPSSLLQDRIIYIGMPLVSAVTELVIAQLMYLQWSDPKKPIYMHINSTGTVQDDNEPVALETEGFAIYDIMMQMPCEIYTVACGICVGQASLLLAAGTKGKRYMMPLARVLIREPRVPPFASLPASEVAFHANEASLQRRLYVELLAKHTGNSVEKVSNSIKHHFAMDAIKAKEFGVIDKILWRGSEELMKEMAPPDYWDKIEDDQ